MMIRWLKSLLPIIVMTLSLVLIFLSICQGDLSSRARTHHLPTIDQTSETSLIVVDCLLKEGCEQQPQQPTRQ
jgi:hypothetical protein